jgi:hypothetical protein
VVKSVRDGGGLSFDSEDVVAAIVMNGGAKVKCAVTVVGRLVESQGGDG